MTDQTVRRHVLAALADGPATVNELCEMLPAIPRASIQTSAYYAHRRGVLRIDAWQRRQDGTGRLAPAWAIADGTPDAVKPRTDPRRMAIEGMRRYRQRNRARLVLLRAAAGRPISPMALMVSQIGLAQRARSAR